MRSSPTTAWTLVLLIPGIRRVRHLHGGTGHAMYEYAYHEPPNDPQFPRHDRSSTVARLRRAENRPFRSRSAAGPVALRALSAAVDSSPALVFKKRRPQRPARDRSTVPRPWPSTAPRDCRSQSYGTRVALNSRSRPRLRSSGRRPNAIGRSRYPRAFPHTRTAPGCPETPSSL